MSEEGGKLSSQNLLDIGSRKQKRLEAAARYREKNREKCSAASKASRALKLEQYKEKERERANSYYAANREACIARVRAYEASDPNHKEKEHKRRVAYYARNHEESISKSIEWRVKNIDKRLDWEKSYYEANAEKIKAKVREWRENNPERTQANAKAWRKANHSLVIAHAKARKKRVKQRTPSWANLAAITEIYRNCPHGYHVDHIIPLNGKVVSGLHVENNLQYLPAVENIRKSNKLVYSTNEESAPLNV